MFGSRATYYKLICVFEHAGYKGYADEVRKIVNSGINDSDSSGSEDSSIPQPPTFPHLSLPSVELPSELSSYETFYLINSATSEGIH